MSFVCTFYHGVQNLNADKLTSSPSHSLPLSLPVSLPRWLLVSNTQ